LLDGHSLSARPRWDLPYDVYAPLFPNQQFHCLRVSLFRRRPDNMNAMDLPRVSIITPSFNQGPFIEETIRSVLSQGYPNLEYIVMDGGSTDETISILKKYEDSLIWVSQKDEGQSHALNKGFRMASGAILGFLNSDDIYEPGALNTVGKYFFRHPHHAWITGRCKIIDRSGKEIRRLITLYKNAWLILPSPALLQVINFLSQPSTFWRREVYQEVGGLDVTLSYAMEYDFWLRASRKFAFHSLPINLARFRVHAQSKSGSSAHAQFDAELTIARRYVRSPLLLGMHRLHCALATEIYKKLLAHEQTCALRAQTA
jgi:cellulose synthase/poly-beta-1,6-N-acetylglucosamine synthase-like glycosyltransferase